jgi:hypothetical protein
VVKHRNRRRLLYVTSRLVFGQLGQLLAGTVHQTGDDDNGRLSRFAALYLEAKNCSK